MAAKKKAAAAVSPKGMAGDSRVWCAYAELVPTDQLQPNPLNPNQHPVEQVALLAKILKAQGWRWPIKVSRRSGLIVSGHCRLEAARRAGFPVVPVDYQDYETDEAEIADLLADNRVQELSILDEDRAQELISGLADAGFNIELTGFDLDSDGIAIHDPQGGGGDGEETGDDESPEVRFGQELTESKNYIVLTFDNDIDWLQAKTLLGIESVLTHHRKEGFQKKGVGRVMSGPDVINRLLGVKR